MSLYYVFLIFVPVIMEWAYEREIHKNPLPRVIAVATLLILMTFRQGVGVDLPTYYRFYQNVDVLPVGTMDLGYTAFNWIFKRLGLNFNVFLFFSSVWMLYGFYSFLDRYVKQNKYIAALIYFGLFDMFVYSLSALRQALAISAIFLAIIRFDSKKYVSSALLLILAVSFHWSVFLLLPFFAVVRMCRKVKLWVLMAAVAVFPALYEQAMSSSLMQSLSSLHDHVFYYTQIVGSMNGNALQCCVWILITEIWIFFIAGNERRRGKRHWFFTAQKYEAGYISMSAIDWFIVFFLILKCCLALKYNGALPRLFMFFYFFLPFGAVNQLRLRLNGRWMAVVFVFLLIILTLDFHNNLVLFEFAYGHPALTVYAH